MSEKANKLLGTLFVIAAPSGAGKTSLVRGLLKSENDLVVSISHTTRPRRPGEEDAVDYHFVDQQQFGELVKQKAFLEHAMVFGHSYGTSRQWVEAKLQKGVNVILEIDWQGAEQVQQHMPNCVTIFIVPPSKQALRNRLDARAQDSTVVINARMAAAEKELKHYHEFNYLVVNDIFQQALSDLKAIIRSQRLLREKQQIKHAELIKELLELE